MKLPQMHLYIMQNASLRQLAGTCSFTHRWRGIQLSLAVGHARLRRGKGNQGVSSGKNLVKRAWYWFLNACGEQQQPPERQDAQLINSEI
jgi:hypothetical protein